MEYNGLYANLIFNSCIMLLWFAFQWRVLDGRRFSVWLTILLAFVINIAYTVPILLYTQAGSMLRILLMPTGPLVMAFALFYGRPLKKILAVGLELAATVLLELMFMPMIMNYDMDPMLSVWADPRTVTYGLVYLPCLVLVLLTFSLPMIRSKNNLSSKQILVFAMLPVSQTLCEAMLTTVVYDSQRQEYIAIFLIASLLFIVSDIILYQMMIRTEQRVQLEVENKLLEKQLDVQLSHYDDLTKQYEQIRAMRHDIYHHLNAINLLLKEGNAKAASEYSAQLLPMQQYISHLGECRNPTVDAFLYSRIREAGSLGINVEADVAMPADLAISNTDLIVLFGNIMDNAIEACQHMDNATIKLTALISRGHLVVRESNPVPEHPEAKKRRIPELERGVGFRVLDNMAEKYNGSFTHSIEDGVYTVTVMLNTEQTV
ncbi:MAG: GHKL domain-containing protein [Firmicutes bacterium]|nr:GHKL domain-containing protein [Bacillota bacterium]